MLMNLLFLCPSKGINAFDSHMKRKSLGQNKPSLEGLMASSNFDQTGQKVASGQQIEMKSVRVCLRLIFFNHF